MKLKSIHDILGVPFVDKYFDVVITENPRLAYIEAKEVLKTSASKFSTKDSELTLYIEDRNNITIVIRFYASNSITNLRGVSIRNSYISRKYTEKEQHSILSVITPNTKVIHYKD